MHTVLALINLILACAVVLYLLVTDDHPVLRFIGLLHVALYVATGGALLGWW